MPKLPRFNTVGTKNIKEKARPKRTDSPVPKTGTFQSINIQASDVLGVRRTGDSPRNRTAGPGLPETLVCLDISVYQGGCNEVHNRAV